MTCDLCDLYRKLSYEHREMLTKIAKVLERLEFLESFDEHTIHAGGGSTDESDK